MSSFNLNYLLTPHTVILGVRLQHVNLGLHNSVHSRSAWNLVSLSGLSRPSPGWRAWWAGPQYQSKVPAPPPTSHPAHAMVSVYYKNKLGYVFLLWVLHECPKFSSLLESPFPCTSTECHQPPDLQEIYSGVCSRVPTDPCHGCSLCFPL